MCNLYRTRTAAAEIALLFKTNRITGPDQLEKDYVSPGKPGWIVNSDGEVTTRAFGRPHWQAGKAAVCNIRNLDSRWWASLVAAPAHRCLVPVTSFMEWSDVRPRKQVWFGHQQVSDFAFAGVFTADWFAFLTAAPNAEVAAVHKKAMPVILESEVARRNWVDGAPAREMQRSLADGSLVRL
ncbi:MAG: SOS response-associated peptidase family protein [Pseudomonadota bacterium]